MEWRRKKNQNISVCSLKGTCALTACPITSSFPKRSGNFKSRRWRALPYEDKAEKGGPARFLEFAGEEQEEDSKMT
jgi:hypothetical protein